MRVFSLLLACACLFVAINVSARGLTVGSPSSITYPTTSTTGSFNISWGAVANAMEYYVEQSENGGGYITIAIVSKSTLSTAWGASNGSYVYRVKACGVDLDGFEVCGAYRVGATLNINAPAPTAALSAVSTTIGQGQSTYLNWSSSSAWSCTLNGSPVGTSAVNYSTGILNSTTNFSLVCVGPGGTTPASVATVTVLPPPVINSLTVNKTRIPFGGQAIFAWNVTGSNTSCTFYGSNVGLISSAYTVNNINTSTDFILSCTNVAKTVTSTLRVTPVAAPRVTISAASTDIVKGESATLNWTTDDPLSKCYIKSAEVKTTPTSYSNVTTNTLYDLLCKGDGGDGAASVMVFAHDATPTITLTVSNLEIIRGGSTSVSVNFSEARSCTLNGSPISNGFSQNYLNLLSDTDYVVNCTGYKYSASQSKHVIVIQPPIISNILATPSIVAANESSKLTWSLNYSYKTTCALSNANTTPSLLIKSNVSSGQLISNIPLTTSYEVSCSNLAGTDTKVINVTVKLTPAVTFTTANGTDTILIELGKSTALNWSTQNAASCTLTLPSASTVNVPVTGPYSTANLNTNSTYSLVCKSINSEEMSQPRTVTVNVAQAWANFGACEKRTGRQSQVCINGSLCTLKATREVAGACAVSNVGCAN